MKDYSNAIASISDSQDVKVQPVEISDIATDTTTDQFLTDSGDIDQVGNIKDTLNDENVFLASWTKVNTSSNGCGCNNACFNSCYNIG